MSHRSNLVLLVALTGLGCSFGPKHEDPEQVTDTGLGSGAPDLGVVDPGLVDGAGLDADFAADTVVPKADDAADGTEGGCGDGGDAGDVGPCGDGATDVLPEATADAAPDGVTDGVPDGVPDGVTDGGATTADAPTEGSAGG